MKKDITPLIKHEALIILISLLALFVTEDKLNIELTYLFVTTTIFLVVLFIAVKYGTSKILATLYIFTTILLTNIFGLNSTLFSIILISIISIVYKLFTFKSE